MRMKDLIEGGFFLGGMLWEVSKFGDIKFVVDGLSSEFEDLVFISFDIIGFFIVRDEGFG